MDSMESLPHSVDCSARRDMSVSGVFDMLDRSLITMLLRQMLEGPLLRSIGPFACASVMLRGVLEEAAALTVKHFCPFAHLSGGGSWNMHLELINCVRHEPDLVPTLTTALYTDANVDGKPWVRSTHKCSRALKALLENDDLDTQRSGHAVKLLGSRGPRALLNLQVVILRRLGLEAGPSDHALELADLNLQKARVEGGTVLTSALLDVAELINLRAYMRTYVSKKPHVARELEKGLLAVEEAARRSRYCHLRLPRIFGRTLASTAHALAHGAIKDSGVQERLEKRGRSVMFHQAHTLYEDAIGRPRNLSDEEFCLHCTNLERTEARRKATLVASLGECCFCIATGMGIENADMRARQLLELSLAIFVRAELVETIEYADALKDYGKILNSLFERGSGDASINHSVRVHQRLLGDDHPRTENARRLLQ